MLICAFVFALAKIRFSHDAAHMIVVPGTGFATVFCKELGPML